MFRGTDIKKLIDTFGKSVTIRYVSDSTYNPATGGVSNTNTTAVVKGYLYDIRKETDYDTLVSLGSRRLAIYPVDVNGNPITIPREGDKIEGHRDTVVVTRVDEVLSQDKVIVYLLRIKE